MKMEEEIIIIGIEQATKTAQGSVTTTSAQKGEATPTLSNVSSGSCCLYRGEPWEYRKLLLSASELAMRNKIESFTVAGENFY